MSKRTLTYHFKLATGQSAHQYQLALKLDMALKEMQHDSGIRLKEIAHRFGFYDEFHFSKAFKKRFKMAPGTFMKLTHVSHLMQDS